MRSLRALVVGTGYAGRQHVDALKQLTDVEIAALTSSPERAGHAAAELGVPVSSAAIDDAIQGYDVVHICTTNELHFDVAERALRARKHVICEKPLALDVATARALVDQARDTPVVTVLAHNYRFFPLFAELCARIRDGELGRVHLLRGHFLQDRMLRPDTTDWRTIAERGGASRAIADIGSHWLDLAELLADAFVDAVVATVDTLWSSRADAEVTNEDQAALLVRFASGIDGTLVVSQIAAGRGNEMEISADGSHGSATWRQHVPNELWIARFDGTGDVVRRESARSPEARELSRAPGDPNESRRNLVRLAYEVIRKERSPRELPEPLPTFAHGLHQLEIAAAALESAKQRRWIGVPPVRWQQL